MIESARSLAAAFSLFVSRKDKTLGLSSQSSFTVKQNNSSDFLEMLKLLRNQKFKLGLSAPSFMIETPFGKLKNQWTNLLFRLGYDPRLPKRKKVVVLGTGWASMKFIQNLDVTKYDVTIISPRDHFVFTPLLPSVCSGILTPRSCLEPIHNKLARGGKKVMQFYEAKADSLNPTEKTLKCKAINGKDFEVAYDYLVVGVGSETNTFGIPGVKENTLFLKEVGDAQKIHKRLLDCFERASLPSTTPEERKKLLHFVMIGAGPSGVETAAEVADFVKKDAKKYFPNLVHEVQVSIIEMLPRVLPVFNDKVSSYTLKSLKNLDVNVLLRCRVTKVTPEAIHYVNENSVAQEIPYGFVLWASGVGQVPFAKHILSTIPEQKTNRVVKVDECLRIIGLPGCYGFGDCTWLNPKLLTQQADQLFEKAKKSGKVSVAWIKKSKKELSKEFPQIDACDISKLPKSPIMTRAEFAAMLKDIDSSFKPPPPTAQAAAQEAIYLANVFNKHVDDEGKNKAHAYLYHWKGQMSYVGGGNSVIQTPYGTLLGGITSHLFWKSIYCARQMSLTNKFICIFDWSRTTFRGRELGRSSHQACADE